MIGKKFNDEKAVTHVIEFTIALTVFVLILQAFTSAMNFRIGIDLDNNDNRIVMAREVVSELTGSMGNFKNITNWDALEFGIGETQLKDGGIVGLLNSNGELDSKKCKALGKFPYPNLKNELVCSLLKFSKSIRPSNQFIKKYKIRARIKREIP